MLLLPFAHAATLSVGSTYATIGEAISAASDGDTLEIAPGTYAEAVDLGGRDLTLVGTFGSASTFIAPPSKVDAITADNREVVTLRGLTIIPAGGRGLLASRATLTLADITIDGAGSATARGGAIALDESTATLSDVTLRGNMAAQGGHLYLTGKSRLTATNLTLTDGTATTGGAIYADDESQLTLTDVLATGPYATSDGGFAWLDGVDFVATDLTLDSPSGKNTSGAGFYIGGYSTVSIDGGSVSNATMSSATATGGAFHVREGSSLSLANFTISDCEAVSGAAIELLDSAAATFDTVTFEDNVADADGGAIWAQDGSTIACDACSFRSNSATDGGAILLATSTSFVDHDSSWTDNDATNSGGALSLEGTAEADLDGSIFSNNTAKVDGGAILSAKGDLSLTDVECLANTATRGDGGCISAAGDLTVDGGSGEANRARAGRGGAVYATGDAEFSDTRWTDNEAASDGGAIWASASLSIWEGVFFRNTSDGSGGAIAGDGLASATIARSYLHGNEADSGGAIALGESVAASLTNLRVTDNSAAYEGGGVYVSGTSQVKFTNNTFGGNAAGSDGGHVYADSPVSLVNNIFFESVDGGGVYGDATGSDRFYNLVYDNAGGDWVGWASATGTSGNIATDPKLDSYTADGDETDDALFLQAGSPCIDAGSSAIFDVDGTRSDIGAFGGPDADVADEDADGFYDNIDCDDADATINPAAMETAYDAIDQDCDGVDLDDLDGDGYSAGIVGGDDCDDEHASAHPGGVEIWYDGIDEDCSGGSDYDQDGDFHDSNRWGGDDCDDLDRSISGAASEIWYDGIDEDCDGRSDYDRDRDGHDSVDWYGDDCDDYNAGAFPGQNEIPYDGVDEDCSGADLVDVDGDGWIAVEAGGTDCDDAQPTVYPGAVEDPTDGFDTDCDGFSEWDRDGDGFDDVAYGGGDCADFDAAINPGIDEVWYDGVDNDCDGRDDDQDDDGYLLADDCDDTDPGTHPDAMEKWDAGVDNDCDGFSELDDKDGDGLNMIAEILIGTDYENPDTDGDSLADGAEVAAGPDTDGDLVIDPLDTDDDGDGISTRDEMTTDVTRDEKPDTDVDGDDIANCYDDNSDGDDLTDRTEGTGDDDKDGKPNFLDYRGTLVGGGCGGDGWASMLLPFPLLFWRRRSKARVGAAGGAESAVGNPAGPRSAGRGPAVAGEGGAVGGPQAAVRGGGEPAGVLPPQGKKGFGWGFFLATGCVALALSSGPAHAVDAHGFTLFGTSGDATAYNRIGTPYAGRSGSWDAAMVFDYADAPLAETFPWGRETVIEGLGTMNLAGGYSFGGLRIDAVMPVHLTSDQQGTGVAPGDARLGVLVPAWKQKGLRPAVGLQASIFAPTGDETRYLGTVGPRVGATVITSEEFGPVGLIAMLGAEVGLDEKDRNLDGGFGPLLGLGAAWRVTDAMSAEAEIVAQSDLSLTSIPVEATLSGRYRLPAGAWATLGGGAGLGEGVGSARWRAMAGVGWSYRKPEPVAALTVDPHADRDGDKIPDIVDKCKDQAETYDGFDDSDGCPELDGDGDGVTFAKDLCPGEPIRPEQDPRYSDGCPKVAEFAGDRIVITEAIFFREARSELLPSAEPILQAVADIMGKHPEIRYFLVEGHTNANGSDAYNLRLSDARAFAVMTWLAQHGVSDTRLLSKGFGESRPLVAADKPDAEAINRRVEFRVISVDDLPVDARRIELPGDVR